MPEQLTFDPLLGRLSDALDLYGDPDDGEVDDLIDEVNRRERHQWLPKQAQENIRRAS